MIRSALQQLQHATTPEAFHVQEIRDQVPYLMWLQREQTKVSGAVAGVASRMTNNTLFSTSRPSGNYHTVVPVNINELGRFYREGVGDPIDELVHPWERMMTAEQYVRLDQKLTQAQPDVVFSSKRATCHALTSELYHPDTGASTEFINYAFVPHDPSELQMRRAAELASTHQSDTTRRHHDQDTYWRGPNQSFRHLSLK